MNLAALRKLSYAERPLCLHCKKAPVRYVGHKLDRFCRPECAATHHRAKEALVRLVTVLCKDCNLRPRRSIRAHRCAECQRKFMNEASTAVALRNREERMGPLPVRVTAPPQSFSGERALPVVLRPDSRPTHVMDSDGWRVNIAVHDAWFKEQVGMYKERRKYAHPDKGGTHEGFLAAQRRLDLFLEKEQRWYKQYGLEVPSER